MSNQLAMGDPEFLNRRIPMNRRYLHVRSVLDTGYSMSKYLEKLEEMNKNYRYRKGEIFKRVMVSKLAELFLSVGCSSMSKDFREADAVELLPPEDLEENLKETSSKLEFLSVNVEPSDTPAVEETPVDLDLPYPNCPYLLLDVRGKDEFDLCHIISASSFPRTWISRTTIPYPRIMLDYRNAPGKMIILYDDNERSAVDVATYLCETGYRNIFMLSGGLKVIANKFPEGMVTGSFPITCFPTRKTYEMPEPIRAENDRRRFTSDELNKIKNCLEILYKSSVLK